MLTGLVFAVFNVHMVYYLTHDLGDEKIAAQAFAALNIALALGTLLFGLLGDKLPLRGVLVSCYFFPAVAMPLLIAGGPAALAFAFAFAAGMPGGGRNALFPVSLVFCFGETHLGAIYGLSNTLFMIGNAVGPALAALVYDNTGSTRLVYAACMGLLIVSAALVALIRREHKVAPPQ
jgi:MFS family permease